MDISRLIQLSGLNNEAMGAPDYNPAKASSGGPGYASMPQQVKLAGDSIWDKEDTNPPMVTITDYEVVEEDGYVSVTVAAGCPPNYVISIIRSDRIHCAWQAKQNTQLQKEGRKPMKSR